MKRVLLSAVMLVATSAGAGAQASALPSAQGDAVAGVDKGRTLMTEMVAALGGDAWTGRKDWKIEGRFATFYKGAPHDEVPSFEEYYRTKPFGERVIAISHFSSIPGMPGRDHKDLAEIWTEDNGYEMTYKGAKPLPEKDVTEYKRRRTYSLESVVGWLSQPDVQVIYEGQATESRHLADKVSILTPKNDVVTMMLDAGSHLPLSLTYQWRDPLYKDLNTDVEQFDDYHAIQGIQTPFTFTRLHNGDMVSQRFVTKVTYNLDLPADLFDPERSLSKSTKK